MNDAQVAFAASYRGPTDEAYFARLAALGDSPVNGGSVDLTFRAAIEATGDDEDPGDDADGQLGASAGRKPSAADLVVALSMDRYSFGRAADGEPFAIDLAGPNVARMFRGGRASLRAALAAEFAAQHGKVPNAQALIDALAVLEGRALGLPKQVLPLRSTRLADGSVVVDMGDETGRAIVVTADGWQVVEPSPVTFRRSELTGALPTPTTGILATLAGLLNVAVEDLPMILAHQVGALVGVQVPIILFRGPAGAAKTSAAKVLAMAIDPSPAPVRSVPKDPEGWAVAAGGSYVVGLDNIDTIPGWLSDALCRAVTGEGYLRRALYTDSAITVIAFKRAIILTGIDPGAMRGDLADRLLAIDLAAIDEEDKREDEEWSAAFAAAHPAILAALLDLTVAVLKAMPDTRLTRRPRMADYGRVLATIDGILGTDGLARYMAQRGELQREAAEGDQIGAAVMAWLAEGTEWTGKSAALLNALTPEHPPKGWPSTPRGLSGALRRVAQPLAAAGIKVTFSNDTLKRLISIERAAKRVGVSTDTTDTPIHSSVDSAIGRAIGSIAGPVDRLSTDSPLEHGSIGPIGSIGASPYPFGPVPQGEGDPLEPVSPAAYADDDAVTSSAETAYDGSLFDPVAYTRDVWQRHQRYLAGLTGEPAEPVLPELVTDPAVALADDDGLPGDPEYAHDDDSPPTGWLS